MTLKNAGLHSTYHAEVAADTEELQPNSTTRRRSTRGLLLRKGVWHIDKVLFGKRVCESTRTGGLKEAEMLLAHRVTQARKGHLYGEPKEHTFREAGVKFRIAPSRVQEYVALSS